VKRAKRIASDVRSTASPPVKEPTLWAQVVERANAMMKVEERMFNFRMSDAELLGQMMQALCDILDERQAHLARRRRTK